MCPCAYLICEMDFLMGWYVSEVLLDSAAMLVVLHLMVALDTIRIQYCRVPKNVLPKNGQAGISRFFKNVPG